MAKMIRAFLAAVFLTLLSISGSMAQQTDNARDLVWVQIEARPSLAAVNESLRQYSAELPNVNGFSLKGSSWLVVALGPYEADSAQQTLIRLRREGRIPQDSYIARSEDYQHQIWPVGANLLNAPQTAAAPDAVEESVAAEAVPLQPQLAEPARDLPAAAITDETPAEARASEARLSHAERAQLQSALQWSGHYSGGIDGAFGSGTRNSMADWQRANGYEATGVLTTRQRETLSGQYNAPLEGLDMRLLSDPKAGIEMQLPLGAVKFARYEPPFAYFDAIGDLPARVLLLSQEGTEETLYGLYEIMQTLEIVPPEGPRERGKNGFTLVGENARIVSHTEAQLKNGQIKGFTLIWPANDEDRRARLLSLMQASFTRIDGVLDPATGQDDARSIASLTGLEIRKPLFTRSGFYVDVSGTVVTSAEVVNACGHVTIDDGQEAEVITSDEALGVAVLRPRAPLVPIGVAALSSALPPLQSEVTVAGFSYGGVLGAPSLTFGTVADIRGLDGQGEVSRLALNVREGDVGGPVLDAGGAVLGMLLPRQQNGRSLPEDVAFALQSGALQRILAKAGTPSASATPQDSNTALAPAQMAQRANSMTVLINCWE